MKVLWFCLVLTVTFAIFGVSATTILVVVGSVLLAAAIDQVDVLTRFVSLFLRHLGCALHLVVWACGQPVIVDERIDLIRTRWGLRPIHCLYVERAADGRLLVEGKDGGWYWLSPGFPRRSTIVPASQIEE